MAPSKARLSLAPRLDAPAPVSPTVLVPATPPASPPTATEREPHARVRSLHHALTVAELERTELLRATIYRTYASKAPDAVLEQTLTALLGCHTSTNFGWALGTASVLNLEQSVRFLNALYPDEH